MPPHIPGISSHSSLHDAAASGGKDERETQPEEAPEAAPLVIRVSPKLRERPTGSACLRLAPSERADPDVSAYLELPAVVRRIVWAFLAGQKITGEEIKYLIDTPAGDLSGIRAIEGLEDIVNLASIETEGGTWPERLDSFARDLHNVILERRDKFPDVAVALDLARTPENRSRLQCCVRSLAENAKWLAPLAATVGALSLWALISRSLSLAAGNYAYNTTLVNSEGNAQVNLGEQQRGNDEGAVAIAAVVLALVVFCTVFLVRGTCATHRRERNLQGAIDVAQNLAAKLTRLQQIDAAVDNKIVVVADLVVHTQEADPGESDLLTTSHTRNPPAAH
jgi:hypothetical protein